MRAFEHPSNKHREEVSGSSWFFALLFGLFYFAVKGAWRHVFIQLVIIVLFGVLSGGPGALVAIPLWIGYAIAAESILVGAYLRNGWIEVTADTPSDVRWDRLGLIAEAHSRGEVYRAPEAPPTPAPAPTASIATDLRMLADMKERGLLSDAEFEASKGRLLNPPQHPDA